MRCDLDGKVVRCMFGIHGCSLPSLHDLACEIAAVLTLHCDVLVALQQGLESTGDALADQGAPKLSRGAYRCDVLCSTREDEGHCVICADVWGLCALTVFSRS